MSALSSAVEFDEAAVFPDVAAVRAAVVARDWDGVRRVVDAATVVGRSALLRHGAEGDGLEGFLRGVVSADPGDSAAVAMLGLHLIDVGWKIRSGARAQDVSRSQFDQFHDRLRAAEIVLLDGVARRPGDPALWVARLISARGLELGQAETRRRYDKLAAIDPHHLPGQLQFLQSLCPKWGGRWDVMQSWCRERMLAAPPGAHQARLVVEGHIERWLDLHGQGPAQAAYLRGDAVRAEIYEAAHRSVGHADFRREHGWVGLVSDLAFVFSMIDDRAAASSMFGLLGDLGTELPWSHLGEGAAVSIRRYRQRAGGVAEGFR
jgi:hypothetical protein